MSLIRVLAIAASIPIVAVATSCGTKEESKDEPKSKRQIPIPEGEVSRESLQEKDGLWYEPGAEKPFTGTAVTRFLSGEVALKEPFLDGKLEGIAEEWLKSGTKKRETHYRDGEGYFQTIWRGDGTKKIETGLKDGLPHGKHKRWHPNGRLTFDGEFAEGKMHGLQIDHDENGVLLMKARFENGVMVEDLMPPKE